MLFSVLRRTCAIVIYTQTAPNIHKFHIEPPYYTTVRKIGMVDKVIEEEKKHFLRLQEHEARVKGKGGVKNWLCVG